MSGLRVADGFALPVDLVVQQTAILARTGAGKTNAATVVVEEVLAAEQQVIIVDPPGAWWGLRSSADGSEAGYSVTVLGGLHGDLPLEAGSGAVVADFAVDHGASVVLDLSEFSHRQMTQFMTAFLERLYERKNKDRRPLLLVVEEADEVAPQQPRPEEARMLGAAERIVKRGRMRGIGTLAITQRSASLNKNVLSQIGRLVAMQTTDPRDRKALDAWVERTGDQARRVQLLDEIATLAVGEAFVWEPASGTFAKIRFRQRRTFDSSATPKPGETRIEPTRLADVDLEALRAKLTESIEKAKADDPAVLRAEIKRLNAQLARRPVAEPTVRTVEVMVDRPVLDPDVRADVVALREAIDDLGGLTAALSAQLRMIEIRWAVDQPPAHVAEHCGSESVSTSLQPRPRPLQPPAPVEPSVAPSPSIALRAGERKMLTVVGRHRSFRVTRAMLATLSGFAVSGGTFNTYFGTLRRAGLIAESDGVVQITPAGLAYLGGDLPAEPQTTADVLAQWHDALRAGERKMLDYLVDVHPNAVTRAALADATGFAMSGGTFNTYLGTLRRNGLVDVAGDTVRASDTLFISGPA